MRKPPIARGLITVCAAIFERLAQKLHAAHADAADRNDIGFPIAGVIHTRGIALLHGIHTEVAGLAGLSVDTLASDDGRVTRIVIHRALRRPAIGPIRIPAPAECSRHLMVCGRPAGFDAVGQASVGAILGGEHHVIIRPQRLRFDPGGVHRADSKLGCRPTHRGRAHRRVRFAIDCARQQIIAIAQAIGICRIRAPFDVGIVRTQIQNAAGLHSIGIERDIPGSAITRFFRSALIERWSVGDRRVIVDFIEARRIKWRHASESGI